jgi:TusA-related sulfurtransferase
MDEYKIANQGITSDHTVDAKGLKCPLPLLRLKKEMANISSGSVLQVDATDQGCRTDIPSWCGRNKHIYLGEKLNLDCVSYFILKK